VYNTKTFYLSLSLLVTLQLENHVCYIDWLTMSLWQITRWQSE